jgi:hypothetical protein
MVRRPDNSQKIDVADIPWSESGDLCTDVSNPLVHFPNFQTKPNKQLSSASWMKPHMMSVEG